MVEALAVVFFKTSHLQTVEVLSFELVLSKPILCVLIYRPPIYNYLFMNFVVYEQYNCSQIFVFKYY